MCERLQCIVAMNSSRPPQVPQHIGVTGLGSKLFDQAFALPLLLWREIEETITDEIKSRCTRSVHDSASFACPSRSNFITECRRTQYIPLGSSVGHLQTAGQSFAIPFLFITGLIFAYAKKRCISYFGHDLQRHLLPDYGNRFVLYILSCFVSRTVSRLKNGIAGTNPLVEENIKNCRDSHQCRDERRHHDGFSCQYSAFQRE